MATKEENIVRLRELAIALGREVDTSGSAMDISQRVMEWEEELEAGNDGGGHDDPRADHGSGKSQVYQAGTGGEEIPDSWVVVRIVKTIHTEAMTMDGRVINDLVKAGTTVRIPKTNLLELESAGLVAAE
jgi:hypothetical protein